MLNKSIITLFGVDLYYMDILLIITIFLYASVALIKFDESSEDKEIRKKILFRRFLVIMCLIGIYLNTVDRKIRNENKVNVNQIIVLDKEAIKEEFKTGADIVVLMPQNYNKEKLYNLAEQYNYKILTKDTMEVRYDKEVKGIENDRIIFRKN